MRREKQQQQQNAQHRTIDYSSMNERCCHKVLLTIAALTEWYM